MPKGAEWPGALPNLFTIDDPAGSSCAPSLGAGNDSEHK